MTNLESIFKSRDITLPTKVHLVKAMVFPVVMYGCENWTIKKAELWRIDAFELWCWRRLLRVPWTAKTSEQSILKEINREYLLVLKLKLQYFGHLMRRAKSLVRTLMLGKIEGKGATENEVVGWHHLMDMSLSKLQEIWGTGKPRVGGAQRVGHNLVTEQQWKEKTCSLESDNLIWTL